MLENLGPRIREIRKQKGLTLVEIASRTGIAQATLSRIETGSMIGTVESHAKIAEILDVELAELYSRSGSRAQAAEHGTRGVPAHHDKSSQMEILIPENGKRKMLPCLLTLQPGGKTPQESMPRGTEKFIYVLEGEVSALLETQEYILKTGETLYFDASLPHFFRNPLVKPAKFLAASAKTDLPR